MSTEKVFAAIFIWLGVTGFCIAAGLAQAFWSAMNGGPFLSPGETVGMRLLVPVVVIGVLALAVGAVAFGVRILLGEAS